MYLRDAAVSMREWLSAPLCFFAIKRRVLLWQML